MVSSSRNLSQHTRIYIHVTEPPPPPKTPPRRFRSTPPLKPRRTTRCRTALARETAIHSDRDNQTQGMFTYTENGKFVKRSARDWWGSFAGKG